MTHNGGYNIVTQFDRDEWDRFVHRHPKGDLFQTPEMYDVYKRTGNIQPCLVGVCHDHRLAGIALGEISNEFFNLFGLTRKTIYNCEPIYNGNPEVLDILLKNIKKKAKGLFVQIRPASVLDEKEKNIYENNSFHFDDHLDAMIPLSDEKTIWKNFAKDKRKGIRKATEVHNIKVVEETTQDTLDIFYSLTSELFKRKRHSLKPIEYFRNLLNECQNNFRIFTAYSGDTPVATQLVYTFKKKLTAFYTATPEEHRHKSPGDLLIWEVIKYGLENNYEEFDFGGAGNPNRDYGPREYKKRFGPDFNNVGRLIFKRSALYDFAIKTYHTLLRN